MNSSRPPLQTTQTLNRQRLLHQARRYLQLSDLPCYWQLQRRRRPPVSVYNKVGLFLVVLNRVLYTLALPLCAKRRRGWLIFYIQGGPKKRGHRLMTIILSILTDLRLFSREDSLVNLQLNGCQKSHRTLLMLLHYLVKQ